MNTVASKFRQALWPAFAAALCVAPATSQTASRINNITEIGRTSVWPHLGAPPSPGSPSARKEAFQREFASYSAALDAIRLSWTGVADSVDDLRIRITQYEDLIRTLTESGGYGNIVLADTTRRLSNALIAYFAVAHPTQNDAARALAELNTVQLLDSPALSEMLDEEIGASETRGGWRLSERGGFESALKQAGSNLNNEAGRSLIGTATHPPLMARRDIGSLLWMVAGDEVDHCMTIPTLLEFERLGGTPEDLREWNTIMQHPPRIYSFPVLGEQGGLSAISHVAALVRWAAKIKGQPVTALVPK